MPPCLLYILYIYSRQGGKDVNIFIDNKSGAPIYDQIYSQIKAQIIGGDLQEDESLPSIQESGEGSEDQCDHNKARL